MSVLIVVALYYFFLNDAYVRARDVTTRETKRLCTRTEARVRFADVHVPSAAAAER